MKIKRWPEHCEGCACCYVCGAKSEFEVIVSELIDVSTHHSGAFTCEVTCEHYISEYQAKRNLGVR